MRLPYRMESTGAGTGGRVSELRQLVKGGSELRAALCALYLEGQQAAVEAIFERGGQCRRAIDKVCSEHQREVRELQRDPENDMIPGELLDYLYIPVGGAEQPPFWSHGFEEPATADGELTKRALLERLLKALAQEHAYGAIREDLYRRTPPGLALPGIVHFEGEDAHDQGAMHTEMVMTFCQVFAQRFVTDGLLDPLKIEKAVRVESLVRKKSAVVKPEHDAMALGKLTLHCRALHVPTALGLMPLVYAAAMGSEDASDWGSAHLQQLLEQRHAHSCDDVSSNALKVSLEPFLSSHDGFLHSLFPPVYDTLQAYVENAEPPLVADGTDVVVNEANASVIRLLVLRRKIFGDAYCPRQRLVSAIGEGLATWGPGVVGALTAMAPEVLHEELEGCLQITPTELLNKVVFENVDSSAPHGRADEQRRLFCECVEMRCEQSGERLLELPALLRWLTGHRTLSRDLSLKPCKNKPDRRHIVFKVDPAHTTLLNHVCYYSVDAPCFESCDEMLDAINAVYRRRGYDAA